MSLQVLEILQSPKADKIIKSTVSLLRRYLRTTIDGLDNVPAKGPLLIVANHSGIAGLDAVILLHILNRRGFGQTKVLAHWAYFKLFDWLKTFSKHWGLCETSIASAVEILKENHCLIIFPEGESGNFKTASQMYRLRKFHTGAVRIAQQTGARIIPVAVIGAEESHINLKTINVGLFKKKLQLPIPLNWFPLPSKWHIRFGKSFEYSEDVKSSTRRLRLTLQKMINQELEKREFIYSPGVDKALAKIGKKLTK